MNPRDMSATAATLHDSDSGAPDYVPGFSTGPVVSRDSGNGDWAFPFGGGSSTPRSVLRSGTGHPLMGSRSLFLR